ncbi:efflux RND transporter periplasmic adaptor subunit [Hoeflea olei]|uniref:Uncharacterized protein n=1 Tax=Hoeflea olei TaxID=1480615 RepID=A0A1C1Z184_9HYPH|nr:efflux RND transporter periplasmic adaptor subunit [Hoeflea olei]OCW59446.1 hypothetical protein AWJ14_10500 [Hoeflea olei]
MRALAVFVGLALTMTAAAGQDGDAAPALRPVVSVLVGPHSDMALSYTGTVVARTETALGFPMIGTIAARPVKVGEVVAKGDVLARLDTQDLNADLRAADAGVTVAEAQLRSATDARDRAKTLADRGVGSATRLEDAERALVSAQAQLDQAQASRARAADNLDLATLTAPYDGVVTDVYAEPGATLSAGQAVLKLSGVGEREIVIDVSEAEAGLRETGDRFTASLLARPDIETAAVLIRIDPVAEQATRTFRLHLRMDQPPDGFRLGALAHVRPAVDGASGMVLPRSALLEPPAVWTVDRSTNTVSLTPVRVGGAAQELVVIESGLSDGDEVVIKGVHSLTEGQAVGPRVTP